MDQDRNGQKGRIHEALAPNMDNETAVARFRFSVVHNCEYEIMD